MDYKAFYADVANWIYQSNHMAIKYGLDNFDYWQWVATSTGELCDKYQNNPLVKMQVTMLFQWLENVYEERKENELNVSRAK